MTEQDIVEAEAKRLGVLRSSHSIARDRSEGDRDPLGLVVDDLGRCPACDGSKRQETFFTVDDLYDEEDWERAELIGGWEYHCDGSNEHDEDGAYFTRPCAECSEPGPPVECEACEGKGERVCGFAEAYGNAKAYGDASPWAHAEPRGNLTVVVQCDDCDGAGKVHGDPQPTGRDQVSLVEAVLRAMPREAKISNVAEHFGNVGYAMKAIQGKTIARDEGDPDARDALAVLADELQARGDRLGVLILAGLRGVLDKVAWTTDLRASGGGGR